MIRLHAYDDGLTGLAAFCDVCGERIDADSAGAYLLWKYTPDYERVAEWVLVHQGGVCLPDWDYDCSQGLDVNLVYLANSVGIDLDAALRTAELFASI